MEAVAILSTVGAVANILDVLAKTICTLNEIHSQWKDVDLTFLSLISQLTSLKAALTKIQEWSESEVLDQHHQLTIDLDGSLKCCRSIIGTIDDQLTELRSDAKGKLDYSSKVRLVLKSKNFNFLQKIIREQTAALTLLLTACNCKAISEQRSFLEKPSTRKILDRLEDDAASLIVLRDSSSIRTRCSLNSNFSKLSSSFPFDHEILGSKVYMRWSRDNLRKAIKARRDCILDSEDSTVRTRERKPLPKQSRPKKDPRYQIPVLGLEDSGKVEMMQHLEAMQISEQDLLCLRPTILRNAVDAILNVLENMQDQGLDTTKDSLDLAQYDSESPFGGDSDEEIAQALANICRDSGIRRFAAQMACSDRESRRLSYLFTQMDRITAFGYVPSRNDMVELSGPRRPDHSDFGPTSKHGSGQLALRLFDPGLRCEISPDLLCQIEGDTAILFVVDLLSYCKYSATAEGIRENAMMRSMHLLKSLLASISRSNSTYGKVAILLLFTNARAFRKHLMVDPFKNHFEQDHKGDAERHISKAFEALGRIVVDPFIQVHFAQANDQESFLKARSWIRESLAGFITLMLVKRSLLKIRHN